MALTKVSTGLISADLASVDLNIDANTLYIDVTNNRVGINNTGPATALDVTGTVSADGLIVTAAVPSIQLTDSDNNADAYIQATDGNVRFYADDNNEAADSIITFNIDGSEATRIDSSGNLLVSDTTANPSGDNVDSGIALHNAGLVRASTNNAAAALDLNVKGRDGDIAVFRKDGSTVGSIGTFASDLNIGTGDCGIQFSGNNDAIYPYDPSSVNLRDALIDIGASSARFKDLYLSSSAYTPVVQGLGDEAGLTFGGALVAPRKNNAAADGTVDLGASSARFKDLYLSNSMLLSNATTSSFMQVSSNVLQFGTSSDDPVTFYSNNTERMRISAASGDLLIGTTDTTPWDNSAGSAADNGIFMGGGRIGCAMFGGVPLLVNRTGGDGDLTYWYSDGTLVGSIGVAAGDRLTISGTSGGTGSGIYFGNTGIVPTDHTGAVSDNTEDMGNSSYRFKDLYLSGDIFVGNGTSAIDANKVYIQDSASTESARVTVVGNNAAGGALFLGGRSDTGGSTVLIRPDGDLENANNSYGAISDQRLKQDIVDAASQWDDIKAMKVRKYRFKSDPEAALQIGLVAQELEESSPGLVKNTDDDINYGDIEGPIKTVKYSLVYMKAVKALQEAMDRIETLEAKVAALEGAN